MSLQETINRDFVQAMKNRREQELSTLRMLKSALKNKQIELRKDLEDKDVLAVVKTQLKQLNDSLDSFEQAGRDDLSKKAKAEMKIVEKYLPDQMGDEELEAVIKKAVEEAGAASKADMGKAMGAAMKAVAGRADGNRVKEIVGRLLE